MPKSPLYAFVGVRGLGLELGLRVGVRSRVIPNHKFLRRFRAHQRYTNHDPPLSCPPTHIVVQQFQQGVGRPSTPASSCVLSVARLVACSQAFALSCLWYAAHATHISRCSSSRHRPDVSIRCHFRCTALTLTKAMLLLQLLQMSHCSSDPSCLRCAAFVLPPMSGAISMLDRYSMSYFNQISVMWSFSTV